MWNAALRCAPCRGYRALGSHLESYFVLSSGNISQMPLHIFVVLFNVLKISSASFLSCYISHLERRWVDTKARVDFLLSSILRCDETNFCSLDANLDGLEEDPCPKTEKYLEAHFVCHSLTDGPPSQGWSTSSVKSTSVNSKSTASAPHCQQIMQMIQFSGLIQTTLTRQNDISFQLFNIRNVKTCESMIWLK